MNSSVGSARVLSEQVNLGNPCKEGQTSPTSPSNNITSTQEQFKRRKLELEHKEVKLHKAQVYVLLFESYPLWLFSLTLHNTKAVFLPGFCSLGDFRTKLLPVVSQGRIELYDNWVSYIGRSKFRFENDRTTESETIYLVSGRVDYINDRLQQRRGIGITDRMWRGRRLPPSALKMLQL